MPIQYKIDVLAALKAGGYSSYRIRKEGTINQTALQRLRQGKLIAWDQLSTVCRVLNLQPGDLLEYVPDKESPVAPVVKEESAFVKAMAQMDKRLAEDHERMLLAIANYKGVEVIGQPKKAHPFEMMLQNERTANAIKPVCLAQEEASEDAAAEDVPDVKQEEAAAGHVDRG